MQRRDLLSLAVAPFTASAAPARAAVTVRRPGATVVLVHGAWHGGWCFAPVVDRLAARGIRSLAIDLPGHATDAAFPAGYLDQPQDLDALATARSPLAALTADDFRRHVTTRMEALVARGSGPLVLVGHSLGGVTLNLVGETSPHLVRRLVYLTALMPVAKPAAGAYFSEPEMAASKALPLFIGDPAETGAVRFNTRSAEPAFRAAAKAAFYADVSDPQFDAVAHLLTPDEPAAVFGAPAPVTPAGWGRLPRTYIRCARDQAIPAAAQDRFIAEADALTPHNRTTVRRLEAGHSPFLSMPDALADLLEEAAT